jgi:hypothetical protein
MATRMYDSVKQDKTSAKSPMTIDIGKLGFEEAVHELKKIV